MAFIYWIGTDRGAASETGLLVRTLLEYVWPGGASHLSEEKLHRMNVVLRKGGHFLGYAFLGVLWARAVRDRWSRFSISVALTAWGITTVWAAIDEFHQSFSLVRSAMVEDVILDASGALAGILLYGAYCKWRQR